jgi:sarcosine oxidase subunit beta
MPARQHAAGACGCTSGLHARYPILGGFIPARAAGVARHDAVAWGYARAAVGARAWTSSRTVQVTGFRDARTDAMMGVGHRAGVHPGTRQVAHRRRPGIQSVLARDGGLSGLPHGPATRCRPW